jgi:ABC-2 type transport system permease protein
MEVRRVKTFSYYVRIYFLIIAQYLKARMQYRVDFIISNLGMFILNFAAILSVWVIFRTVPALAGWSLNELIFIYAFTLLSLCPSQLFFENFWQLRRHLRDGSFIKYYFKPLNMLFYFVSDIFDLKGFSQVVLGVGLLVFSSVRLGLAWPPDRILLLAVMILSSSFIFTSLLMLSSCTGFWIINSLSITNFLFNLRDYVRYPLNIFNDAFRFIFTYIIPTGFIAYFPAQFFLRAAQVPLIAYFTPLAGLLLFAIANAVWSKGVNHYPGTGS